SGRWRAQLDIDRSELSAAGGGTTSGRRPMRRRTPTAAVIVVGALLVSCSKRSPSIVDPKGTEAHRVAGVWWLMFGLAAAVYVVVAGFILVAAFRGRGTVAGRPSRVRDNTFVWVGGIIVPAVILLV